jgi:uncharacterized membrane protein YdjX (TVP38/TMEM64 family)
VRARVAVRGDPRYRRWVVATTLGELGGFAIAAVAGAAVTAAGAGQGLTMALLVLAGPARGAVLAATFGGRPAGAGG